MTISDPSHPPRTLRRLSPVVGILQSIILGSSLLFLAALALGGLFIAPGLRRGIAEAAMRHLITDTERTNNGDVLKHLARQLTTSPTFSEKLVSTVSGTPIAWPTEALSSLTELFVASLVVGPGEGALRLSEQLPDLTTTLPSDLGSQGAIQLTKEMHNLLTALRDRAHLIREEQLIAEEIDQLQSACRRIRTDLAQSLELGDQSGDGSPCEAYQLGPLAGLPRLKPLRAEPSTPLALAQLLRAAGSAVDTNDPRTMRRLAPRFEEIQAPFAALLPKLTAATKRLVDNQATQRRLSSATFVQQERFIEALLTTIHETRLTPLHRWYDSLPRLVGTFAVRFVAPDRPQSTHPTTVD